MALFTAMVLQVNGNTEIYNQSLDIDFPESSTDVDSVTHGPAGVAPGPQRTMVSASNAILASQSRFDWQKAWREYAEIDIRIFQLGSSKSLNGTFICKSVKLGTSGPGAPTLESLALSSTDPGKAPIFE